MEPETHQKLHIEFRSEELAHTGKTDHRITDEEFEYLVQEIAERIKDVVYINAEEKVRKALEIIRDKILVEDQDREIQFRFTVIMLFGDLRQIIARYRRKKQNA